VTAIVNLLANLLRYNDILSLFVNKDVSCVLF
jgi:hypothetical protein